MTTKLKNTDIKKVDLVTRGANPGAKIMLFKSADAAPELPIMEDKKETIFEAIKKVIDTFIPRESLDKSYGEELTEILVDDALQDLWTYYYALRKALTESISKNNGFNQAEIITIIQDFSNSVLKDLPKMLMPREVFKKLSPENLSNLQKTRDDLQAIIVKNGEAEIMKRSDEDQKLIADLEAKIAKYEAEKVPEEPQVEDVLKNLPEEVKKRMEEIEKRALEAEQAIQKMQDERYTAESIAKAKSFENIAIDIDKVAPVLKRLAKADPEGLAELETVLRGADEAIKQSKLFKSAGSSEVLPSESVAKMDILAAEMVTKGIVATKEQAILKMMDMPEHKELIAQVAEEEKSVRGNK